MKSFYLTIVVIILTPLASVPIEARTSKNSIKDQTKSLVVGPRQHSEVITKVKETYGRLKQDSTKSLTASLNNQK